MESFPLNPWRRTGFWVALLIIALVILGSVGNSESGSSNRSRSGVSQSPSPTTAAQGYQSEYGGEISVYNRILAMTDCSSLQAQFDIAGDNNDLAEPGPPLTNGRWDI